MLMNFTAILDIIIDKKAIMILAIKKYLKENLFPAIVFICIITEIPPKENKAVIIGRSLNISLSNSVIVVISIKEFIITEIFVLMLIFDNRISVKTIITDEKIIIIQILKRDTEDDSTAEIRVSEEIFILSDFFILLSAFLKKPEIIANKIVDMDIEIYIIIPAFFDEYNIGLEIPITKAGEGI